MIVCFWPSGSFLRTERGDSSQLHSSKELCVNSKAKLRRASKHGDLPENSQWSQRSVICVNYHNVVSDPHRFIVREYSFDHEEKKQQELTQLSTYKKEQYVSQIFCPSL